MKLVRYTGPNDWSALYVDGNLETVGDHHMVDERIASLCNVELREGDDFLMGSHSRNDTADSLQEIEDYVNRQKDRASKTAASLREKAANLLLEAQSLEDEYLKS